MATRDETTATKDNMIRLKIIKPHKKYALGQTVYVTPNEAHGLLDGGFAVHTKDMTQTDMKTKGVKRGRPS